MNLSIEQILIWLEGASLKTDGVQIQELLNLPFIKRVNTDTRTMKAGDLFIALAGENFDGNAFLSQAQQEGAVAAICARGKGIAGLICIEVDDTLAALGLLAKAWRAQFKIPVIAVTGSNGKTTTTQLIASILEQAFSNDTRLATEKNHNNAIGVPLTLLRLRPEHQVAVVELGMNHPGEIAILADMVRPTVALINNAMREHLEFMGTVEAVAMENGAVLQFLSQTGTAILPKDDAFCAYWQGCIQSSQAVFRFSSHTELQQDAAEVQCLDVREQGGEQLVRVMVLGKVIHYVLPLQGVHNVKNSLAAVACCAAIGVDAKYIEQGIASFKAVKGRLNFYEYKLKTNKIEKNIIVIDDSYNANPDSVDAAIEVLAKQMQPSVFVLGSMGEVGEQGALFHEQAAQHAKQAGIKYLFTFGSLARNASAAFEGGRHFDDIELLMREVRKILPEINAMLIKGSRSMRMERVLADVLDWPKSEIEAH